jgi:hypothetical protein
MATLVYLQIAVDGAIYARFSERTGDYHQRWLSIKRDYVGVDVWSHTHQSQTGRSGDQSGRLLGVGRSTMKHRINVRAAQNRAAVALGIMSEPYRNKPRREGPKLIRAGFVHSMG